MILPELRRLAEGYTAAWSRRDAPGVAALYSPEGSLSVNGGPPAVGRAALTELAQGFITTFPDLHLTMDGLSEEGGRVVYRWTLTGTNRGPGGSGKRVKISGFEEWRIGSDGLIAESLGHFDSAEYERQLQHGVDAEAGTP